MRSQRGLAGTAFARSDRDDVHGSLSCGSPKRLKPGHVMVNSWLPRALLDRAAALQTANIGGSQPVTSSRSPERGQRNRRLVACTADAEWTPTACRERVP